MHEAHEFLRSLTVVLAVAAITTVVFQRLRQPVILGYIIAGIILGPHVPIPLVADPGIVQTLSELGVILLMFSLGLEFSLAKLVRVGPRAGITALLQSSVMAWLGFLTGRLFGWTVLESIFAGAVIAISSTTIIVKVFEEQAIGPRLRELVIGILLVQDLIAVILIAVLTAVATGVGLSALELGATIGRLAAFLVILLAAGMLVFPRFIGYVMKIGGRETTLVASIGACFATAYLAQRAGYSVALGAFLAGSLIAESGRGVEIEHLVRPVRDMFAAVFFVSVGLLLDPALILRHWGAVAVFTVVVVVGMITSVTLGAFLTGNGTRRSIRAGMSLAQIGEFSFIIAGLGVSLGAARGFLYPVAVAVSAITTLTTPWLIRASAPAAAFADRKLPHALQTFSTLYGAWLERMRAGSPGQRSYRIGRIVRLLAVDAAALSGVILAVALGSERAVRFLVESTGMPAPWAAALLIAAACALALPLILGIGRLSSRLGTVLATRALPEARDKVDLDAAPRDALVVTLRLGVALGTAVGVLAITQPFLPSYAGPLVLGVLVLGFGAALWRSATNLEGHVRAGAQVIVEALARHARAGKDAPESQPVMEVQALLPGLGAPVAIALPAGSPAIGVSLAELNLRGRTGATVLAISRGGESITVPVAAERLKPGDVLALIGTRDAVEAAKELLLHS